VAAGEGVCTACELYPAACKLTFVCTKCGRRLNACERLVGGFACLGSGDEICNSCDEEKRLSKADLARLRDKSQAFKLSYRARRESREKEGVE